MKQFLFLLLLYPVLSIGQEELICSLDKEDFSLIENGAEFPGGIGSLFQFIESEVKKVKLSGSVEKKVLVKFSISATGEVSNICLLDRKSVKEITSFDYAIIEILKKMPKWKPATRNGSPVDIEYIIPIDLKGE